METSQNWCKYVVLPSLLRFFFMEMRFSLDVMVSRSELRVVIYSFWVRLGNKLLHT